MKGKILQISFIGIILVITIVLVMVSSINGSDLKDTVEQNKVIYEGELLSKSMREKAQLKRTYIDKNYLTNEQKEISLDYLCTETLINGHIEDRYADSFGNEYGYNPSKDLFVSFMMRTENYFEIRMKEKEGERIADEKIVELSSEFMKDRVHNAERYKLASINFIEYSNEFSVDYYIFVDGYKLACLCSLEYSKQGELVHYIIKDDYELYKELKSIKIEPKTEDNIIIKGIEEKYGYEEIIEYTIDERIILYIDGKYVMDFYGSFKIVPKLEGGSSGYGLYLRVDLKDLI